jgi:uncharacterized protein (TIGR02001 family)
MMQHWIAPGAALAALVCGPLAAADFSATGSATSDYVFRGISQSAEDPVLQGSLDVETDAGAYLGVWGSRVDFGDCCDEDIELDWYAGFGGEWTDDWRYDAGLIHYAFPGASEDIDYAELYLGVGWRWLDLYGYWTEEFYGLDEPGWYLDATADVGLPLWGLGLKLHYGYTGGDALDAEFSADTGLEAYADWSLGVTRGVGPLALELAWSDTSLDGDFGISRGPGANDGRLVLAVSSSIPW